MPTWFLPMKLGANSAMCAPTTLVFSQCCGVRLTGSTMYLTTSSYDTKYDTVCHIGAHFISGLRIFRFARVMPATCPPAEEHLHTRCPFHVVYPFRRSERHPKKPSKGHVATCSLAISIQACSCVFGFSGCSVVAESGCELNLFVLRVKLFKTGSASRVVSSVWIRVALTDFASERPGQKVAHAADGGFFFREPHMGELKILLVSKKNVCRP